MEKKITFITDENVIFVQLSENTNVTLEQDNYNHSIINNIIAKLQQIMLKQLEKYIKDNKMEIVPLYCYDNVNPIIVTVSCSLPLKFETMNKLQDYMMEKGYKVFFKNITQY